MLVVWSARVWLALVWERLRRSLIGLRDRSRLHEDLLFRCSFRNRIADSVILNTIPGVAAAVMDCAVKITRRIKNQGREGKLVIVAKTVHHGLSPGRVGLGDSLKTTP